MKTLFYALCATLMGAAIPLTSHALQLTTWNLQHMMSPAIFDEWASFCRKYEWDEDKVKASGVQKPKRLTYCNSHNGFLFPTNIPESKPLQTKATFQEKINALITRRDELNSDVFALQEVSDEAGIVSIFPTKDWHIVASKADIAQNIGFAIRRQGKAKFISAKQIDELSQSDESESDKGHRVRPGLELTIEVDGKRLVLLNIHLKASCRGQAIDEPVRPNYANEKRWREIQQGCRVLRKQVPALENWVEAQTRANALYLILGDWNRDFKRDLPYPARLDENNPQAPLKSTTRVGSMIKEISDNEPEGAYLTVIIPKIQARNKSIKAPGQRGSEKVCHQGIDNFALSESLMQLMGIDKKSLKATGSDYGDDAYGVDRAMPSDHCPVTLKLPL